MDKQKLIDRFEAEMAMVARERPDAEKLMGYIRGSDFYTAPASTKYHLKYPLIWALHTADVIAMSYMEAETGNKPLFLEPSQATAGEFGERLETGEPDIDPGAAQEATTPASDEWQEAPLLQEA